MNYCQEIADGSALSFCRVFQKKIFAVFQQNRSTYYKWLHRSPSVRELENRSVRAAVFELCTKTDKRLATRKIKDCLNSDYCITVELAFVKRGMKPFANSGFCKKKPDTDFDTHRIKIGVRLWSG